MLGNSMRGVSRKEKKWHQRDIGDINQDNSKNGATHFPSVGLGPGMVRYPPGLRGSWLRGAPDTSMAAWAPQGLSLAGRPALRPRGASGA